MYASRIISGDSTGDPYTASNVMITPVRAGTITVTGTSALYGARIIQIADGYAVNYRVARFVRVPRQYEQATPS